MKYLCVSISPSNTASYSMGTITWEWAISAKSHRIFISFKAQPQEPLNSLYIQHRRTGAILFRWCEICARCVEGDGHDACVLMWLPAVQLFSVRLFEWMTFLREWLISFKQVSSYKHFFFAGSHFIIGHQKKYCMCNTCTVLSCCATKLMCELCGFSPSRQSQIRLTANPKWRCVFPNKLIVSIAISDFSLITH